MEFWAQIKPNNCRDLISYWSQTYFGHVLEFGIWQQEVVDIVTSKLQNLAHTENQAFFYSIWLLQQLLVWQNPLYYGILEVESDIVKYECIWIFDILYFLYLRIYPSHSLSTLITIRINENAYFPSIFT